jgi:hypothetical protein
MTWRDMFFGTTTTTSPARTARASARQNANNYVDVLGVLDEKIKLVCTKLAYCEQQSDWAGFRLQMDTMKRLVDEQGAVQPALQRDAERYLQSPHEAGDPVGRLYLTLCAELVNGLGEWRSLYAKAEAEYAALA